MQFPNDSGPKIRIFSLKSALATVVQRATKGELPVLCHCKSDGHDDIWALSLAIYERHYRRRERSRGIDKNENFRVISLDYSREGEGMRREIREGYPYHLSKLRHVLIHFTHYKGAFGVARYSTTDSQRNFTLRT